jgi:tetratricopeptide (TPR) repeat protein
LRQRRAFAAARGLGYAALAAVLSLVGTAAARESELGAPAPFRAPQKSAQWIAQAGGKGTIFAADNYGGYLIWTLFPEHRPYLDTRLILRTAQEYSEYLRVVDEPDHFDAFQHRHGFDYVVLPTAYPDRYLGLVAHLYRSPEWKLVYTDGTETLFALRVASVEPAWDLGLQSTTTRILASIEREFSGVPAQRDAARMQLATLELSLGEFDEAEQALSGIARPEARALLARCLLARGDARQAREISLRLLTEHRDDVQSLNLLAILSLGSGDAHAAVGFLRRALAADPFDAEAERILSSMEDLQHVESP